MKSEELFCGTARSKRSYAGSVTVIETQECLKTISPLLSINSFDQYSPMTVRHSVVAAQKLENDS